MHRLLRLAVPVLLFLAAWEGVSRSGVVSPALFPPPSAALAALWGLAVSGTLWPDVMASMSRVLFGLAAGSLVAIPLGLATGRVRAMADALGPLIQLFRPLPPVAIIPLIIVWFGIGEAAKVFSIGFAVFFPVWLNTHLGSQQISQKLLWCASTLTHSRWTVFQAVIFPAALPFIVAGLRNGIAVSFVMVFVSELAGASSGIGYEIATTQLSYRIDRMIAALAVLGGLGAIADASLLPRCSLDFPMVEVHPI